MIITRTPFRMSFLGGGTDVPDFFTKNSSGGAVLSATFNKFCYVILRKLPPFFEYNDEIVHSDIERVDSHLHIKHPLVKNAMDMMGAENIRLSYEADLPARSGLGTSSSFAVGTLNAFHRAAGKKVSKRQLAEEAIYLERTLCGEAGGWQDQIAAAYGGLNRIDFTQDGKFQVRAVSISEERKRDLEQRLLMFFTGFTRNSFVVQKDNLANYDKKFETLQKMYEMVNEGEKILTDSNRNLDDFGILLNEAWEAKKSISGSISTDMINKIYQKGIDAGALGGKLLGAGGGGFLVFYVPEDKQQNVLSNLSSYMVVPFNFESEGTKVLYCSEEIEEAR